MKAIDKLKLLARKKEVNKQKIPADSLHWALFVDCNHIHGDKIFLNKFDRFILLAKINDKFYELSTLQEIKLNENQIITKESESKLIEWGYNIEKSQNIKVEPVKFYIYSDKCIPRTYKDYTWTYSFTSETGKIYDEFECASKWAFNILVESRINIKRDKIAIGPIRKCHQWITQEYIEKFSKEQEKKDFTK